MSDTRRDFLKKLGLGTVGAGVALPLLDPARWVGAQEAAGGAASAASLAGTRQWAMVVDVEKCLRDDVRRACVEACDLAHNVPTIPDPEEDVRWIWSADYEHVFPDEVHAHTPDALRELPVMVMCNHCTDPSCVKVCPTGATWKREEDGIVMMDMHRCIGCRYCMAACPYGARSFNWRDPRDHVARDASGKPLSDYPTRTAGVVEKCTFCAERIRVGGTPACVEAAAQVPGGEGALTFGDVSDPASEVSRLLRDRNTVVRRVGLGTGPNVYYIVPGSFTAPAADGEV
jgi:molybdopterin-containing oxidoreductase family iron-sulfur binding subunit